MNIRCPLLIPDGETDHNPTPADVRKIEAELKKNEIIHEINIYPEVGHGFMGDHPSAARDAAVKRAFEWLHEHLPTTPNTYVETRIAPPTR